MKKVLILALSCLLVIISFSSGLAVLASTNVSSGIYRTYYPVHEISLLNKSDSLSVTLETLNFNLDSEACNYYSHKLFSTYSIRNSGTSINTQIAVPLQGNFKDTDFSNFNLTVNGETVAPTNIYLDKTTILLKAIITLNLTKTGISLIQAMFLLMLLIQKL